jgi:hypothetical protein
MFSEADINAFCAAINSSAHIFLMVRELVRERLSASVFCCSSR